MKLFNWTALPVCIVTISALATPHTDVATNAIAGSIASSNDTHLNDTVLSALEHEYEKLEVLKHQLFELHHQIHEQEHEILLLINKDFQSCSGVTCYFQTALKKAPDFFYLIRTHFRYHPQNSTAGSWECPWSTSKPHQQDQPGVNVISTHSPPLPPPTINDPFHFDGPPPPPAEDSPFDFHGHVPPPPPPPPHSPDGPVPFGSPDEILNPDHHGPPPPPPLPPRPEFNPHKPNPNLPAPRPEHPHHDKGPNSFHMPHPAPPPRHFRLILTVSGLLTAVTISACLFAVLFRYWSNPRVRADHAARIEEHRTRREYRHAACQHRIRQCLSRFRRGCGRSRSGSGIDDYEEKRAMLVRRDSESEVASHIVGADINSLRRAHEIVGQLMRAEEGRIGQTNIVIQSNEEPVASPSRSVRSLQTMTTLPPYQPPPPRYSMELSRDMEVVDGFRFTPTHSQAGSTEPVSSASSFILNDDDLCTESSVADCRSRMSMDTESIFAQSQTEGHERSKKSLDLSMDRFCGQFD